MRTSTALLTCLVLGVATSAAAQPDLKLPFMSGEVWSVTRAYNTASHVDYGLDWVDDRYAVDFVESACTSFGKPILAPAPGRVIFSGWTDFGYGNHVVVDHGNGFRTRLAHLTATCVRTGENVGQGQVVGWCGRSGSVYGSACGDYPGTHLHLALYRNGDGVQPEPMSGYTGFRVGMPACVSNNDGAFVREFDGMGGSSTFGNVLIGIGWSNGYNYADHYFSDGRAKTCYWKRYENSRNGWYRSGIVYDALGGARRAYTIRTGFWEETVGQTGGDGWSEIGGPTSSLGMPITNEYATTYGARQDFQRGYLKFQNGNVTKQLTAYTPGWTSSGWDNSFSYLFTMAYDRNGRQSVVGNPTGPVRQRSFNNRSRKYFVQEFSGGSNGQGAIIYDPDNAVANPSATNEAYYVYGSFWVFWKGGDVTISDDDPLNYGLPTRDWYYSQDPATWQGSTYAVQNFMKSNGEQHYMLIRTGTVMNGAVEYHSPPLPSLVTGPGQLIYRDKLTFSFNVGNIAWFRTHYPVAGRDYSQTAPAVKLYRNGQLIVGYKEQQYLYITEGYDSGSTYEADYPRQEMPVSYGYTLNGWATLTTTAEVLGGSWGNTHSGVALYRNGELLTCYKEVGSNLLVTPAPYVSGGSYLAAYPTQAPIEFITQVSTGPGQVVYQERLKFREQIGNTAWFSTANAIGGGDYSATSPLLKIYKNGQLIVGYKEFDRVYVTEGYDPTALYTIDYPRTSIRIQYAYTYNGVPTFSAPSPVWGGVWNKTHVGLRVYKDGVQIPAFKEVGTSLIVTPGTPYDPSGAYDADYVEVVAAVSSTSTAQAASSVDSEVEDNALAFNLSANPVQSTALFAVVLPREAEVRIEIYDVVGRRTETLNRGRLVEGRHSISWDAGRQKPGVYFARLSAGNIVRTVRLVLLK